MTRFEEIGRNFIIRASSLEKAKESYDKSCEMCCLRGMRLDCDACCINTAYEKAKTAFRPDGNRILYTA